MQHPLPASVFQGVPRAKRYTCVRACMRLPHVHFSVEFLSLISRDLAKNTFCSLHAPDDTCSLETCTIQHCTCISGLKVLNSQDALIDLLNCATEAEKCLSIVGDDMCISVNYIAT